MRISRHLPTGLALAATALLTACDAAPETTRRAHTSVVLVSPPATRPDEPIEPLPTRVIVDRRLAALGQRLFHDPLLSADGTMACAACHVLADGGDDGKSRSTGVNGDLGAVNAPTVLNAGLHLAQFWDGRASTLEEQAAGPVSNPSEMALDWASAVRRVAAVPAYRQAFEALFDDGVTESNIRTAIAIFEHTLITPDSPMDRWLRGNDDALTAQELAGYALFKDAGCATCHQGRAVGGNLFQRFGVMNGYFEDRGDINEADLGRFNVTGDPDDRHVFKVPSLRNVALTDPYFHDASAATLGDAVRIMGLYQLGRLFEDREVDLLVAFLRTLTGRLPTNGGPG